MNTFGPDCCSEAVLFKVELVALIHISVEKIGNTRISTAILYSTPMKLSYLHRYCTNQLFTNNIPEGNNQSSTAWGLLEKSSFTEK